MDMTVPARKDSVLHPGGNTISRTPTPDLPPPGCEGTSSRGSTPGPSFKDASGNIGSKSAHREFLELNVMDDIMEGIISGGDNADTNWDTFNKLWPSDDPLDKYNRGSFSGPTTSHSSATDTDESANAAEQTGKDGKSIVDAQANINENNKAADQDDEGNIPMADPEAAKDDEGNVPMPDAEAELDAIELPDDDEFFKRQLRPQSTMKKTFQTTWLDTDNTENYDPIEDERQQRLKRRRANFAKRRPKSDEEETTSEDAPRERPPPVERPKLIAFFAFGTKEGKRAFKNLVRDIETAEQAETAGYKLRTRNKDTSNHECRTEDHVKSSHDNIDLCAKPFARGCWGCVHLTGKDGEPHCSLLDDERDWPCQACRDDDHDCELILPPVQKRACELCKRRKLQCSYRTTRNHGDTCKQCADVGYRCIAGPVKDLIRPRIRLDRDWQLDPLPKKKKTRIPEDCLECRQVGSKCVYPPGIEGSACIDCKYVGLPCTIASEEIPESSPPTGGFDFDAFLEQAAAAAAAAASQKPQPSGAKAPPPPPRPPKPPMTTHPEPKDEGEIQYISTSFCHPIQFNCNFQSTTTDQSCNFCTWPAIAFSGCSPKPAVQVLSDPAQPGFTEISNGHADSLENTRLCADCTTQRMSVLMCDRHEMRPIPGVSEEGSQEARLAFIEEKGGDAKDFCAICQSLASYECTKEQVDGMEGCGLKLCESCALQLEGQSDGDLKKHLVRIEAGVVEVGELLRADVEFFKQDGALMKYATWLSEQD